MTDKMTDEFRKSNFFFHLTPDIIMKAVEDAGFDPTGHCMALNSYENRVYDLMLEDRTHIVAKFYRPGRWTKEEIIEEHKFLLELQEDEIPVCAPLHFHDMTTLKEIEGIYYAVWPRTGGRQAEEFTENELETLGRLLARIHNMGAVREAPSRGILTGENYGLLSLEFLEENNFIPQNLVKRYRDAVVEIVNIYETLREGVPFHRIHGDCHKGNLLNGRDGWFFLDFDDFLTGPAVQDVWMLVPARDSHGLHEREVFLDAYRQFRDFDPAWLRLIEPLRALRYIKYSAWIARRWKDPAFPSIFPHFGTAKYWEDETKDLEEQLEYFHGNTTDIPHSIRRDEDEEAPKEELTNKDYFWDMDD